jgi:hypothetical protein
MANESAGGPATAIGARVDWIVAQVREVLVKASGRRTTGMLLDDDPKPVDHALRTLQEHPRFDVDEKTGREFAAIDDLADRRAEQETARRPSALTELEPDTSG